MLRKSTKCEHRSLQSKVANGMVIYRCRDCHSIRAKNLPPKSKVDSNLDYCEAVGLDRNIMWLVGAN